MTSFHTNKQIVYNLETNEYKIEYIINEPIICYPLTTQQEPMHYKFHQNCYTPNWYEMKLLTDSKKLPKLGALIMEPNRSFFQPNKK